MPDRKDLYANKFYGSVVESAANTLTFKEIQTSVDTFSKRAWILHRLEWYIPPASVNLILAADDVIQLALVASDKLSALDLSSSAVIDLMELSQSLATAVGFAHRVMPFARDFNTYPGGGLIITPRPLYVAVKGASLASAVTVAVRGYFTAKELSADEYLELVDFYRIVQ
jgi:hypothetical protein